MGPLQLRSAPPRRAILAIASGGGHWVQLLRLRPAFENHEVSYVTTLAGLSVPGSKVFVVRDASRTDKLGLLILSIQLLRLIVMLRPSAVVTTGAAPGVIGLRIAKLLGVRTIWIDSIANVDELSLSGLLARKYADLWLTQWAHLVEKYDGLQFRGAVL
jgi:UDP-N-acetylglucosamine:LPS N-acetylglucosamine transferase